MSVTAMAAVWPLDIPSTDKMVLLALADAANDDGKCWPSIAGKKPLTAKTSLSERAIQGAIKWLCAEGHLSRREVPGKGVVYHVHPRSTCTPAFTAPAQETSETPAPRAPKPSVTTKEKVQATPSPSPRSRIVAGDFTSFWQAYPKKVGRADAERAYLKACRVVPPDKLLAATLAYAASRFDEDPQFTPHPATWLNRGSYEDPIEEPRNVRHTGRTEARQHGQPSGNALTQAAIALREQFGTRAAAH